jgi:hypothetical protein
VKAKGYYYYYYQHDTGAASKTPAAPKGRSAAPVAAQK